MLSFSVVSLAVNDVFHELHGLRFIDIHKFPVAHNPFPFTILERMFLLLDA